jgi:hypothetical protein
MSTYHIATSLQWARRHSDDDSFVVSYAGWFGSSTIGLRRISDIDRMINLLEKAKELIK